MGDERLIHTFDNASEKEMEVFDKLPSPLRKALNEAQGGWKAAALYQMWSKYNFDTPKTLMLFQKADDLAAQKYYKDLEDGVYSVKSGSIS